MPKINAEILVWARETAGLSLEEAAATLRLGGSRSTGAQALGEYETGVKSPSRSLLVKMAKRYRRPLLTFYLPQPPASATKISEQSPVFGKHGYSIDLTRNKLEEICLDPFLIDYAASDSSNRVVVSIEVSVRNRGAMNHQGPEVCRDREASCYDTFAMLRDLGFTTAWVAPV